MQNSVKKSFLSLLLLLPAIFVLGGVQVTGAQNMAPDDELPCFDITGKTTPVNVGAAGIANSGEMNFDAPASVLDSKYAGCVRMSKSEAAIDNAPVALQGWVWNSNLGWISLYCDADDLDGIAEITDAAGQPKTNLGVPCGNISYRVAFVSDAGGGYKLQGYAWGDNVGWIKFGDDGTAPTTNNFFQIHPLGLAIDTALTNPQLGLISKAASGRRNVDAYTWADSVGWFDWSGVQMPWVNMGNSTLGLRLYPVVGGVDQDCNLFDANKPCDESMIPKADGQDSWTMEIETRDGGVIDTNDIALVDCNSLSSGFPITEMTSSTYNNKKYVMCLDISWKDSVDLDQTNSAAQNGASSPYSTNDNGAVRGKKQNFNAGDFSGGTMSFEVKSYAPTSDRNFTADTNVSNSEKFNNERFIYPTESITGGYNPKDTNIGSNEMLQIGSLNLMLFKFADVGLDGECIYGNDSGGRCSPKLYLQNKTLSFDPVVKFTTFNQEGGEKDLNYLSMELDSTAKINSTLEDAGSYTLSWFTDLDSTQAEKDKLNLKWVDDRDQDASEGSGLLKLVLDDAENKLDSQLKELKAYLYTKICVTNILTSCYWGAKLPRVQAGILKNPVAKVSGNVYGTGLNQKASDVVIRSLGSTARNERRDQILKNVSALINNLPDTSINNSLNVTSTNLGTKIPGTNNAYYVDGDLTLGDGANALSITGNNTYIVNGNIFVKSNIMVSNGQLGLIALRDEQPSVNALGNGNLYLSSAVTDMTNVQIFLDGVMVSYDGDAPTSGSWPTFADDFDRQDRLKNQFRLVGTLASSNGIGNASGVNPVDDTGAPVGGQNSSYGEGTGLARAKAVDLNFLRFYGPYLEVCPNGAIEDQQVTVNAGENPCNDNTTTNPNYFINVTKLANSGDPDNTESGDLLSGDIAGAKKSTRSTEADQWPSYFEYAPIDPKLPGFATATVVR